MNAIITHPDGLTTSYNDIETVNFEGNMIDLQHSNGANTYLDINEIKGLEVFE